MQNSRDSSVWRTLAVAFGDGLAFGVGVTLTRGAARLAAPRSATSDSRPANGWNSEVEHRRMEQQPMESTQEPPNTPLDQKAIDAVLTAIDGKFTEIGGQINRRLADLDVRIAAELDELDTQDHALAHGVETRIDGLRREIGEAVAAQRESVDADMRALRGQITTIHKEFAEALARLVDEQITKRIDARFQSVQEELRETIRDEIRLNGADQQIAELRERVDRQEGTVVNLLMALGQGCLQALERISPAAAPPPASPPSGDPDETTSAPQEEPPAADPDVPGFARTRPRKPLWRVPIVSSFLAATGGLLLLHYL